MSPSKLLEVVIIKPSKYLPNGYTENYWRAFLPNMTPYFLDSLTPQTVGETTIVTQTIDEYTNPDLRYLNLLQKPNDKDTNRLIAFAGVQSHQFHRAADLAALAVKRGAMAVIGGPHPITCDTTMLQGKGVSFALGEAELMWHQILFDASCGQLQDVYGAEQRWQYELEPVVVKPPPPHILNRNLIAMYGSYPSRGCPFKCNYCSVIQIAGHVVRNQTVEETMAGLRLAKQAGAKLIVFGSDNFNKFELATDLLQAMIDEKINIPFFVQCDVQIADQEPLIELLGRAKCAFIFVGVESFDRATLVEARKTQNNPDKYGKIIDSCRQNGIIATFSNIIGFPNDTEQSVNEHVNILTEMAPGMAWFYILTPIPGTEQYGDFLRDGLITERNLDRFDCTGPVWQHPNLSHQQLLGLQFGAYEKFYSVRNMTKRLWHDWSRGHLGNVDTMRMVGFSQLMNMAAARQRHPMSGGIGRRRMDHDSNYRDLRRSFYGYDIFPLPQRLLVSKKDQEFTDNNLAGSLRRVKQKILALS